ncbi:MAG: hypothetical protein LBR00_02130 [Clostridiales Family XIII bacterium]|nr:hypothetical protein [Clostridiales Family XIII bacterium]
MRSDFTLVSLQEAMKDGNERLLDNKIEEFSCSRDADVAAFLKEKAIHYERSGLSRTYLYFANDDETYRIAAFFSVAITSTDFEGISKSMKAKVLGGKPGRDTKDHFGMFKTLPKL